MTVIAGKEGTVAVKKPSCSGNTHSVFLAQPQPSCFCCCAFAVISNYLDALALQRSPSQSVTGNERVIRGVDLASCGMMEGVRDQFLFGGQERQ